MLRESSAAFAALIGRKGELHALLHPPHLFFAREPGPRAMSQEARLGMEITHTVNWNSGTGKAGKKASNRRDFP